MKLISVFACLLIAGCASSPQIAKMEYPPMPSRLIPYSCKEPTVMPDGAIVCSSTPPTDTKVLGSQSGDVDGAIRILETEIRKQNHQQHMELQFVVHYDEK